MLRNLLSFLFNFYYKKFCYVAVFGTNPQNYRTFEIDKIQGIGKQAYQLKLSKLFQNLEPEKIIIHPEYNKPYRETMVTLSYTNNFFTEVRSF